LIRIVKAAACCLMAKDWVSWGADGAIRFWTHDGAPAPGGEGLSLLRPKLRNNAQKI